MIGENPYEPRLGLTGTQADGLCKTKKLKNIETTLSSIKDRVQAWLKSAGDSKDMQTLKALFSSEDIDKTVAYVPRWPLFVHIFAAIT